MPRSEPFFNPNRARLARPTLPGRFSFLESPASARGFRVWRRAFSPFYVVAIPEPQLRVYCLRGEASSGDRGATPREEAPDQEDNDCAHDGTD